jgi:hypothetical protein
MSVPQWSVTTTKGGQTSSSLAIRAMMMMCSRWTSVDLLKMQNWSQAVRLIYFLYQDPLYVSRCVHLGVYVRVYVMYFNSLLFINSSLTHGTTVFTEAPLIQLHWWCIHMHLNCHFKVRIKHWWQALPAYS